MKPAYKYQKCSNGALAALERRLKAHLASKRLVMELIDVVARYLTEECEAQGKELAAIRALLEQVVAKQTEHD